MDLPLPCRSRNITMVPMQRRRPALSLIEEWTGIVDNLMVEVAATEKTLTNTASIVPFTQLFSEKPFILAGMQSANGGDTAVLGINNLSAAEASLVIVEETSANSEVTHIPEIGGYIAITPYTAAPSPPSSLGFEVGEIMVDSTPVRVNFSSPFSQPVIIANTVTRNDTAPSVIRISDVDTQGFTIQIQAYDYLATGHGMETISYLVMEKGSYTLDDGTQIEAGLFDTDATTFAAHSLVNQFNVAPVVFTSIITNNDPEAVIGRVRNISTTGFEYRLQEQEANARYHDQETVAYLAWTPGSGTTNGIHFQVGNTADAVTHKNFIINFNQDFSQLPFQFAGMQTTDGGDTASVKIIQAGTAGMEIMVEEEASRDSETNHTKEIAGFLVLLPE